MHRSATGTIKESLIQKLPVLILCFCAAQPLLDAAGYWQDQWKLGNTLTLGLRMLLLAAMVLLGFLLSERKRFYYLTGIVLLAFTGLHALACVKAPDGYQDPVRDLTNLIRIYMLPLTVLCFATFLSCSEKSYKAVKNGLLLDLLLIAGIQLISLLTGTDPHTYQDDKIGVLGWFLWTNSQSAILSMLFPLSICWALGKWKKSVWPVVLVTLIGGLSLYALAPRLSYFCLAASGLGVGLWVLLFFRARWKQGLSVMVVTLLLIAAYPISPTHARQKAVEAHSAESQAHLDQKEMPSVQHPAPGESLSQADMEKFDKIYHSLGTVYSVVERFGLSRALEAYDYSLDSAVLGNARLRKITFCRLLMEDGGILSRLFGLNLSEMFQFIPNGFYNPANGLWEDGYESLDVENDFHGIFFLTGLVGLALMAAYLLYFALRIVLALRRLWKTELFLDLAGFSAAFCCAVLHAAFTASILRRNNASVYLAIVLAAVWYLSGKKKTAVPAEPL